ncbi:MAG TPA: ABC transporter substrate-binding protein [Stellaceae bacterium]|nr:ABC transporter substrate-binding protein [Stellaceae bacterium]
MFRKNLILTLALSLAAISPALAQSTGGLSKVNVETTAGSAGAALFAAKGEGFFAKHGIDANITLVNLMPNFPPALVAGSEDVAFMVTTTFLQAIEGGLDLVAFAGGSATSHKLSPEAVIGATGTSLKNPPDFIGKKVGVPGIGATLQVMFRYWLDVNHVDSEKVKYVEVAFPTMRDQLAGHSVDAVVATDPFIAQMVNTKAGYVATTLNQVIPENLQLVMYTSTRDWAKSHPKEVAGFRAAIVEGAAFAKANPDKTKDDINVYAKLPAAVMKSVEIGYQLPELKPEMIAWWIDAMKQQHMLNTTPDVTKLIWKAP